ncbi:MAG: hypothetical protein U5R31_02545 [Acidimicrobiia bacterium]|nr:hypothetical protein [Acidimicrobiia bacterium]
MGLATKNDATRDLRDERVTVRDETARLDRTGDERAEALERARADLDAAREDLGRAEDERDAALGERAVAEAGLDEATETRDRTSDQLAASRDRLRIGEQQVGALLDCVRTANAAINAAGLGNHLLAAEVLRPTAEGCALVTLAVLLDDDGSDGP